MADSAMLDLTITQYIQRLSKQLNIKKSTKGIYGSELELIALVRNCQFLYDRNLPDFRNIVKKNEAWDAIAAVFDVSVGEVQTRWKAMRDVYSKIKNKNGGFGSRYRNCPYYDDMKFLEPYVTTRRSRMSGAISFIEGNIEDSLKLTQFHYVQQFIQRIKKAPVLYDNSYKGPQYAKQKVEAWLEISKECGTSVQEVLNHWRNLRDRYSRERRNKEAGVKNGRSWELYEDLSFLDEHIKPRRKVTREMSANSSSDPNICYVVTSPKDSSSDPVTLDSSSFLREMSLGTKKEIAIEDVEFFDVSSDINSSPTRLFNEENHLSENNSKEATTSTLNDSLNKFTTDEDDLFGQTVAAELRKIECPKKKMKLKVDIYKLIYEQT